MTPELAALIDRWRDGGLDADERAALAARLRADPEYAAAFHAEVRFQGQLAGALHRPGDTVWRRLDDALAVGGDARLAERVLARLRRRALAWPRWAAAAAAALLLAVLGLYALRAPGAAGADVDVLMTDERGDMPQQQAVPPAAPVALGNDQHAQFAFRDGSRVEVGTGSAVRLAGDDAGGARLELTDGSLQAEIARQTSGSHFVVQTKEALMTVLGTRFTVLRFPWGTRVEVTEGRVLTRQLADGAEVEVPAGMWAEVRRSGPRALVPASLRRALPAGASAREPVADAIVVAGRYARDNRGGAHSHILTSPDAPPDERREFYLRFDLAGLHRPVSSAQLFLHLTQLTHPGMRLEIAQVPDARWNELTITWDNRPAAGAVVGEWRPGPDDAPIELTAAVNQATGDVLSLRIRATAGTPPHAVVGFNTREALEHKRPCLVVVPAP